MAPHTLRAKANSEYFLDRKPKCRQTCGSKPFVDKWKIYTRALHRRNMNNQNWINDLDNDVIIPLAVHDEWKKHKKKNK